jgi:hypothetical protein
LAHFLACFATITRLNEEWILLLKLLHVAFLLVWTVTFWIMDSICLGLASYESWTMCVELVWLDSGEIKLRLNLTTNNPLFPRCQLAWPQGNFLPSHLKFFFKHWN